MAGMHFIILKVNGVDVSQMPHEDAVKMFLKASEPILVEVRRRSYKTNADAEYSNSHSYFEKQYCETSTNQQQLNEMTTKKQSSITTTSLMTPTHTYLQPHHHLYQQHVDPVLLPITDPLSTVSNTSITTPPPDTAASAVDSLKFNSLVISSNKFLNNHDFSSNSRQKNNNVDEIAAAVGTSGSIHSNNSPNRIGKHESLAIAQSRSASITSLTSPIKSTTQSPFKASTTSINTDDKVNRADCVSIGIQTENFSNDFIFNRTAILDSEQIIENDHNLFSECLAPEIDIEEITLRKSESNERLGLTVCYSSGGGNGSGSDDTDTCTEVYISDIVPDSIAGRDGRLRQGDQILQVNGKDVSNKEETETLIAENNNAVTLLVSRYLYGDDDEYNDEQGDFYEDDDPNMEYGNCFLENYIVSENVIKSAAAPTTSNHGSPEKPKKNQQHQVNEEIDRLPSEQQQSQQIGRHSLESEVIHSTVSTSVPENIMINTLSSSSSRDPLNHQNIRAHLDQVNQEIAILDSRVENMMMPQKKNNEPIFLMQKLPQNKHQQQSPLSVGVAVSAAVVVQPVVVESPNVTTVMEYDTEHIYETIPEDSESEPFYCSPYESSEHQNRVEQWLDMQDATDSNDSRIRLLQNQKQHHQIIHQQHQQPQQQHYQQQQHYHDNLTIWTKAKNGTLQSADSSAGDDHENSSSAYNTGGSCNSNTMTPLTLELNTANYKDRKLNNHSQSTLILCPSKLHTVSAVNETTTNVSSNRDPSSSIINYRHSKEKPLSPSHGPAKTVTATAATGLFNSQPMSMIKQKVFPLSQKNAGEIPKSSSSISATSNTMYTNVANLQQTMLLQQQLFRQALIQQRLPPTSNSLPCPQFTAPNLSQYHFVSSQEVSSVKLNTHPSEEPMVWKVKRRQDGTRYIVRRPARNRFLRNRAMRISAERNDDQTTEDDTISEIKTGRYWTKEERKKHIERARERRQRQQIIITNKNNEISMHPLQMSSTSMTSNMNNHEQLIGKSNTHFGNCGDLTTQQQQKPSTLNIQSPGIVVGGNTSNSKANRQINQASSNTTKKLTKKTTNTTNSPTVDVNNSPLIVANPPICSSLPSTSASTNSTTTISSAAITSTTPPISSSGAVGVGNRMFQGSNNGGSVAAETTINITAYHQTRVLHPPL